MPHSPTIKIIDLKKERKKNKKFTVFSEAARSYIIDTWKRKKQLLVFINRKGAATTVICQDCGFVFKCPQCDIPLTFHKSSSGNYLQCHHCNYQEKAPSQCSACKGHRLLPLGIGTERVAEELKQILPLPLKSINIEIIEGQMKDEKELRILEKFAKKEVNILIGTEALLRPQLQITDVTIVPSLDPLLFFPDFQSEEKVWHLLTKLKKITKETMIIQTLLPQHKLFSSFCSKNQLSFLREELEWRRLYSWPPYTQLIRLEFKHKNLSVAKKQAASLKQKLTQVIQQQIPKKWQSHFILLGPSPAFLPKEKGYYRFNLFLKFLPLQKINSKTNLLSFGLKNLSPLLNPLELKLRNKVLLAVPRQWKIDVNPKDTL